MENYLGRKVKHDILNPNGVTLITSGTRLSDVHLLLLKNHNVDANQIVFLSAEEEKYRRSVTQVVDASKDLFKSIESSHKIPLMEIRSDILPAIQQIAEHANVFQLFQAVKATDEYTYQHNIGVGVLSTLIGRWMELSEPESSILSIAATLHDVGKIKIPIEILNKPEKLSNSEFAIIKNHTIYGYELLKDTVGLNYRIPLVALQHHERNDGKGYPFGLKHDKIDFLSKIVAVADIFHAMSSKRPYHNPIPFYEIVSQMRKGKFGELDPYVVSVFLENIVKKMVGENVILTDGRIGEVVYLNPHDIETPLVKVDDEFIDLSKYSELHIMEISL